MTKKKRFGISEALTRGLTETIHVVENNAGMFRNVVLPLSRIELDPDNPRKLTIDLVDVRAGIQTDDPSFTLKQEELERLKELAHTIKTNGVINPVVVYKSGEVYRVVAGERRCLASIIAGKQEIDARVFQEKPKAFELKLIQWVENTAREDLTLDERLGNIRDIIHEYLQQHAGVEMSATLLKSITGLSLSQCTYYVAALNAPQDVRVAIQVGNIRNLDKAAMIAGIASQEVRRQAIEACSNGSTLKQLRTLVAQSKTTIKQDVLTTSTRGRRFEYINLGRTSHTRVVKSITDAVLQQKEFVKYADVFSRINWNDVKHVNKAFRKLIEIMEGETVV